MITKTTAIILAKKYNINLDIIPIDEFLFGLNVELEHRNITHGNYKITTKIVIAHLLEDPRYYYFLRKLEQRREKYWSTKTKPNIFR